MAAATKKGSKKKSKMTWARLANDPSISKSELPRIAAAFGLSKPKSPGLLLKGEESRKPKKTTTPKPKTKTASKTASKTKGQGMRLKGEESKAHTPRHRGRTPTQTQDAGPEGAYKSRLKIRRPYKGGQRVTVIEKKGPTKARRLTTARGRPIPGLQGPKPGSRRKRTR